MRTFYMVLTALLLPALCLAQGHMRSGGPRRAYTRPAVYAPSPAPNVRTSPVAPRAPYVRASVSPIRSGRQHARPANRGGRQHYGYNQGYRRPVYRRPVYRRPYYGGGCYTQGVTYARAPRYYRGYGGGGYGYGSYGYGIGGGFQVTKRSSNGVFTFGSRGIGGIYHGKDYTISF